MAGEFRLDSSLLNAGLVALEKKSNEAVRMYANTAASKLESHAKKNRPWTDRTGLAKMSLRGYVEPQPSAFRIFLAHGVEYGINLELNYEKKYAIIQPTILALSPDIMKGLDRLLEKL